MAPFGTTFGVKGSYRKAETSFLKRVTRRIFIISKWFHRSKQKRIMDVFHKKTVKNCENHQRSHKKYCFGFYRTKKNYSAFVKLSLYGKTWTKQNVNYVVRNRINYGRYGQSDCCNKFSLHFYLFHNNLRVTIPIIESNLPSRTTKCTSVLQFFK